MKFVAFMSLVLLPVAICTLTSCSGEGGLEDASSPDAGLPDSGVMNPLLPPMPLGTQGRWIVDAKSNRVRLSGFNWNGAEGPDYVMSGLDTLDRRAIAAAVRELGFNSVRLVWSNELVEKNPVISADKLAANPDLIGGTALEVMDAVVSALAAEGVMIVMNNHISDAIWCCKADDDNVLWYNSRFPEKSWLADWRLIAARYKDQPAVIAADLRNEPRFLAAWGDGLGREYDWASAAERGGKAVQEIAPHWLIVVEGTGFAADLSLAGGRPVQLTVPNKLVYSVHDYPWFHPGAEKSEDILKKLKNQWAYLIQEGGPNNVPIWLGETATCTSCIHDGSFDSIWFGTIVDFIRTYDLDWSWWMLHGDCNWGAMDRSTNKPCSEELMGILKTLTKPTKGPGFLTSYRP